MELAFNTFISYQNSAKKGHGFSEASYTLQLAKSSSLLSRKSYIDFVQKSLESLMLSQGTEQCPVCPYSYFLYKAINDYLKPTQPTHILQSNLWTWWQIWDGGKKNCYLLSTYLPNSALGNFEQICSLDTINKLYKERDNKWFSWDFTVTGFDPKAHAF